MNKLPRTHKKFKEELEKIRSAAYASGYADGKKVISEDLRFKIAQVNEAEKKAKFEAVRALSRVADQLASVSESLSKALMSNVGQL